MTIELTEEQKAWVVKQMQREELELQIKTERDTKETLINYKKKDIQDLEAERDTNVSVIQKQIDELS